MQVQTREATRPVRRLPNMPLCECGCSGEAHDLMRDEAADCLRCDTCTDYRPVRTMGAERRVAVAFAATVVAMIADPYVGGAQ